MGLAGGLAAKTIGSLMVFALIMLPSVIAKEYSKNIRRYFSITVLLTLAFGYGGLIVSIFTGLPSSGSIAAIASFSYIISIIYIRSGKK
jgi:zinc transport system permease protein